MKVYLRKSSNPKKKYMVNFVKNGRDVTVHFGQKGASDFTRHKDPERKERYIARHKVREVWTKNGMIRPAFWSRWLLWNKSTLYKSIEDVNKRFGLNIIRN